MMPDPSLTNPAESPGDVDATAPDLDQEVEDLLQKMQQAAAEVGEQFTDPSAAADTEQGTAADEKAEKLDTGEVAYDDQSPIPENSAEVDAETQDVDFAAADEALREELAGLDPLSVLAEEDPDSGTDESDDDLTVSVEEMLAAAEAATHQDLESTVDPDAEAITEAAEVDLEQTAETTAGNETEPTADTEVAEPGVVPEDSETTTPSPAADVSVDVVTGADDVGADVTQEAASVAEPVADVSGNDAATTGETAPASEETITADDFSTVDEETPRETAAENKDIEPETEPELTEAGEVSAGIDESDDEEEEVETLDDLLRSDAEEESPGSVTAEETSETASASTPVEEDDDEDISFESVEDIIAAEEKQNLVDEVLATAVTESETEDVPQSEAAQPSEESSEDEDEFEEEECESLDDILRGEQESPDAAAAPEAVAEQVEDTESPADTVETPVEETEDQPVEPDAEPAVGSGEKTEPEPEPVKTAAAATAGPAASEKTEPAPEAGQKTEAVVSGAANAVKSFGTRLKGLVNTLAGEARKRAPGLAAQVKPRVYRLLYLANEPYRKLAPDMREFVGWAALVTAFMAVTVWIILILH